MIEERWKIKYTGGMPRRINLGNILNELRAILSSLNL